MEHCTERENQVESVELVMHLVFCEHHVEKSECLRILVCSILVYTGLQRRGPWEFWTSLCMKYKRLCPSKYYLYKSKGLKAENLSSVWICGSMVVFL